jgi:acetate kinase
MTAARWKIHGVLLDEEKNAAHGRGSHGRVSSDHSRIACLVVPTNEELMIARETLRLTADPSNSP